MPRRPLSASRTAVLDAVTDQPEPVTIQALVTLTRLHENTLREHLGALVRAGLVRRIRGAPAGRGRPSWRYERIEPQGREREYAAAAATLARGMAGLSPNPVAEAEQTGEAWGHRLLRDRGAGPAAPSEARSRLVELMDDLGFDPRATVGAPAEVRLTRCPLLEAAHRHPEVACAVHLGLARGALQEQGVDPAGTELVAFSEPGACLLRIPPFGPPLGGQSSTVLPSTS
jgi:predicted ArsR family transcriptional regulator